MAFASGVRGLNPEAKKAANDDAIGLKEPPIRVSRCKAYPDYGTGKGCTFLKVRAIGIDPRYHCGGAWRMLSN
jgi:hypothetical protein